MVKGLRLSKKVIFITAIILVVFVFIFIQNQKRSDENTPTISVAATIFPIYDMVRFIADEHLDVKLLLPEGESPAALGAIYQGVDFSNIQTVFAVGHEFDTVAAPEEAAHKIYTVDKGIDMILEQGSTGSPYYWLSVKQAPIIAKNIAEQLSVIDPANRPAYEKRLAILTNNLTALDKNITDLFVSVPSRKIIVYGYDWSYFARDYGLDIVYYQPAVGDTAFDAVQSKEFSDALSKNHVPIVFSDFSLSPQPLTQYIFSNNVSLVSLDVFGGLEDRASYSTLMGYNARTIFEGLVN